MLSPRFLRSLTFSDHQTASTPRKESFHELLSAVPWLESVHISTYVGKGLHSLISLTNLRRLSLYPQESEDLGVFLFPVLSNLLQLESLELPPSPIAETYLSTTIQELTHLTRLVVRSCQWFQSKDWLAITKLPRLRSLELEDVDIGTNEWDESNCRAPIEELNVRFSLGAWDRFVASLKHLSGTLRNLSLSFSHSSNIELFSRSGRGVGRFSPSPFGSLSAFQLSHFSMGHSILFSFCDLDYLYKSSASLVSLNLHACELTGYVFEHMTSMQHLRSLAMVGCSSIKLNFDRIGALTSLTSLTEIDLSHSVFMSELTARPLFTLTQLRRVRAIACGFITNVGILAFNLLPRLEYLAIDNPGHSIGLSECVFSLYSPPSSSLSSSLSLDESDNKGELFLSFERAPLFRPRSVRQLFHAIRENNLEAGPSAFLESKSPEEKLAIYYNQLVRL